MPRDKLTGVEEALAGDVAETLFAICQRRWRPRCLMWICSRPTVDSVFPTPSTRTPDHHTIYLFIYHNNWQQHMHIMQAIHKTQRQKPKTLITQKTQDLKAIN